MIRFEVNQGILPETTTYYSTLTVLTSAFSYQFQKVLNIFDISFDTFSAIRCFFAL